MDRYGVSPIRERGEKKTTPLRENGGTSEPPTFTRPGVDWKGSFQSIMGKKNPGVYKVMHGMLSPEQGPDTPFDREGPT